MVVLYDLSTGLKKFLNDTHKYFFIRIIYFRALQYLRMNFISLKEMKERISFKFKTDRSATFFMDQNQLSHLIHI